MYCLGISSGRKDCHLWVLTSFKIKQLDFGHPQSFVVGSKTGKNYSYPVLTVNFHLVPLDLLRTKTLTSISNPTPSSVLRENCSMVSVEL